MTPITDHRDYMKELRTRLSGAGLAITDMQFYNHFVNSLPAEYDMIELCMTPHHTTPSIPYVSASALLSSGGSCVPPELVVPPMIPLPFGPSTRDQRVSRSPISGKEKERAIGPEGGHGNRRVRAGDAEKHGSADMIAPQGEEAKVPEVQIRATTEARTFSTRPAKPAGGSLYVSPRYTTRHITPLNSGMSSGTTSIVV
jgi:hypothetical protein